MDEKVELALEHSVNAKSDEISLLPQGCAHCSWKIKLEDFSQLNQGDHICIDGRMFRKTLNGRPKTLYKHHAIVAKVERISTKVNNVQPLGTYDENKSRNNSKEVTCNKTEDKNNAVSEEIEEQMYLIHGYEKAVVTLIEVNREKKKVVEESYAFDLKLLEIYKVVYDNDTKPSAERLKAAQRQIGVKWDYHIWKNNCEHFCNECCTGDRSSVQAETCCRGFLNLNLMCMELAKYIRLVVFHFLLTADDAVSVTIHKMHKELLALDIFLSVLFRVIFYLLHYGIFWAFCSDQICCLYCRRKCPKCKRYYLTRCGLKKGIWLIFQVGPTVGVVVLVYKTGLKHLIIFFLALGCSAVTIILVLCVSRCYKHPIRKKSYEEKK